MIFSLRHRPYIDKIFVDFNYEYIFVISTCYQTNISFTCLSFNCQVIDIVYITLGNQMALL